MGPIFSWIKFCSSRTNRQSTKVLSVFLKNRLPYLPYLLSSWGIPVFKHKGTGSSNACLQKRKSTSLQVSQGFLLTGPKAKLCKLTQPSQHGTPGNRHWTNGAPGRKRLPHACVPGSHGISCMHLQLEQNHRVWPQRGSCHRRTLIGHYRKWYDVGPWKYAPVICKIKRVGTLWVQKAYCRTYFCLVFS